MKLKFKLLVLIVISFSASVLTLHVQGQSACSAGEILGQADMLVVERSIPGCKNQLDPLVSAVNAQLETPQSAPDTARYRTILALAYQAQGSDFDARITMQQALLDWRNAGNSLMEGRVLYYLGKIFYDIKQLNESDTFYSQADKVAAKNKDAFTQGRIKLAFARHELSLGNNENALGLLEDSLPMLLQYPVIAVPEQIENLTLLSRVNRIFEKFERSEFYNQQASFLSSSPDWYNEVVGTGEARDCTISGIGKEIDILSFEHALPNCVNQLPDLLESTQSALDATSEPSEQALFQTLAGLVYYASGDYYNATMNHERALLLYRGSAVDPKLESWTLYYMARTYFAREQLNNVMSYLGQSQKIATAQKDVFQLGRSNLFQAQYEIQVNNDYNKAVLLEEEGLLNLQTAGDVSLPEQIQMLDLLNQTYSVLGDLEKAGNFLRLSQGLKGNNPEDATTVGSSLEAVSGCQVNNLVNQFDVIYVERQLAACYSKLPGLMLTAQSMVITSKDTRSRGIAQMYVGMGHYFRGDVLTAYIELDAAVTILRQVGDPRLLGFAYYYLALNEYAKGQEKPAIDYFDMARTSWEKVADNFDAGRVYLQLGVWANKDENWDLAISYLERALANIQSTPIYSLDEQRTALSTLIEIHRKHIQNEQRVLEYEEQLSSLYNAAVGVSEPTPVNNDIVVGETPEGDAPATASCDPRSIVMETDLIVAEQRLSSCPQQLEDLLYQVQTVRQQATEEIDIAFYQNFLGIVEYYQGNYANAITEHNRALTRYRTLGEILSEGRSLFYAGRSYLANGQVNDANTFLSQAQRVSINAGDARNLANIALLYGNRAYNQQNIDEALKQYEFAIQQLEQVDDPADKIVVLLRVGQIQDERSNYDIAIEHYNQVAELAKPLGESASYVLAKVGLARYDKYFGRYDAAVVHADDALAAAEDETSKVIARAERADIARYMEDYDTARDLLSINVNAYNCQIGDMLRLYTGYYHIAVGEPSKALEQFRPLFEPSTCPERTALTIAQAYAGTADAQLIRQRSDELVLQAINEAIREFDRLNYPRGYESTRIQMATYYFYLRQYAESERWLSTVERKAREINDLKAQSEVQMLRVEISIDRGLYSDALINLERASSLYNRLGFTPGLSSTLEQQLRIYLDQARYNEAIDLINFAKENYGSVSISFDSRIAYYQGRYYQQIGQTELAMTYFDQALAGFKRAQESLSIVDVQLQRARILQQRGQNDEVQTLVESLRPLVTEQENNFYLAQIDAALGDNNVMIWRSLPIRTSTASELQEAERYYEQALANYISVNNVAGQARINNSLGELQLLKVEISLFEPQRYQSTSAPTHRALELYRVIGNSLGVADSLYNLGRFALLTFDNNEAESYFYQALDELGDGDPLRRANILTQLGLTYENKHAAQKLGFGVASNDLYIAMQQYEAATELLSVAYAEIADQDTQRRFGTQEQMLAPYTRLLRIYAVYTMKDKTSDATEALFYAEQSRARSYLTQLQGEQISLGDTEENNALTEWQALRKEVISLNQLLSEIAARSGDNAETENIELEVKTRLDRMKALESDMQLSSLQQFVGVQVSDLPTIQAALPDDTMMVSYYVLPEEHTTHGDEAARILMLLISKDQISKVSQHIDDYQQKVLNQVDALLRSHSPAAASSLYKNLIIPIQSQLTAFDNLVIVPHNVLNYVPFEALIDTQGKPLLTSFNTSYVPSATVYTLLRSTVKAANHEGMVMGLGYSGEGQNLDPLTYYATELKDIENVVQSAEVFVDDDATESRLVDIANVDVIHFAAHGRFDGLNPLSSYIALAPQGDSDGLLEVREVYELSLRERNPLITLSACELAVNQLNPGDELEGMTRAFLLTGARGVIASMWPVDDYLTSELMRNFYQSRAEGMSNAQALTAAKRQINEIYDDPYLWAGFVLVGLEN